MPGRCRSAPPLRPWRAPTGAVRHDLRSDVRVLLCVSVPRRAGGTRTPNHRFWRPGLCQLSYCPTAVPDERRRLQRGLGGHDDQGWEPPKGKCTGGTGRRSNRAAVRCRHPTGNRRDTDTTMGGMSSATPAPSSARTASPPGSARIAESATLAVDAKAKALKAAGRAGHRLRRRRAGLPDPRLHRRGGRRGLPRPEVPPLHPGRRAARAQGGDRREDARATAATPSTRPRCWSPTAASRRSTRRSRRCSTRATRCCCRRRTGRPTPSRSGWPAASRSRC